MKNLPSTPHQPLILSLSKDGERFSALVIFVVTLALLMLGSRTQGNVRDEGYYFEAAEQYWSYYGDLGENILHHHPARSFTRAAIDRGFSNNHEHPALMKTLFGVSWRVFHRAFGLLSEEAALRLPTQISVALMVMLIFLLATEWWSMAAGFVAAGLTLFAPRLFFDAQLATFDAPIAALWVATVYSYYRSLSDRRWGWRTGVIFGLALATKHNAFFIPVILLGHYGWTFRQNLRRVPHAFLWMALLSPLVYLACWPWLWFDTVARFAEYAAFHLHHVYYNMEYFGTNYNKPPFPLSFPYVMTLLTVPVTTLALALTGAVRARFRSESSPMLLIVLNAIFPMAIITLTRAPIFGATKHWHAAIPFLALLAAGGFQALVAALPKKKFAAAFAALCILPAAAETFHSHPYGLSHYNLLAGGPQGAATLGMNRQFWGYASRGLLPFINQHAPPHAPIYFHDTNQSQLNIYVRQHLLRRDITNTPLEEPGVQRSNLGLVIHEKHFNKYEYWFWDFYGTTQPTKVLTYDGVPIVTLYERPKAK